MNKGLMMATWQFADVGNIALILGLVIAIYVLAAALYGAKARRPEFLASAKNGIYVIAGLATLAIAVLEWALLTNQFRFEYVASHVSSGQPLLYTLSALWGGQEGSLLFWAWLLAIFGAIAILQNRDRNRELVPYVMVFLAMTQAFFFVLILFTSSPFKVLPTEPLEGNGLNPLLQNPGMFIHPVTQYIGFVGFTIPWAFAMAALVTGRLGEMWIQTTRRWALFSWLFLSLGLLFGMRWAYVELGWGGYWGWDPVENAALVPWLTGTAYLHSIMIQEKRGMLKVWNLGLVFATFWLSIWGTFDTRSGLAQSVHAFGVSTLGPYFLAFIFLTLMLFLYLVVTRLDRLKDENELDSVLSREATFLFNNLILVGAAFIVWWGSHFPTISEVLTGRQISVAAPFFNQMVGPILLALLLLVGVCTLIGWRRASADNFIRNFTRPLVAAFAALVILFVVGVRDPLGLVAFTGASFVLATIVYEFYRGTVARHRQYHEVPPVAAVKLVTKNRRRYGGYIVHLGVVLIAFGIAGSNLYQTSVQQNLKPGETLQIGSYTLRFDGLKMTPTENKQDIVANMSLLENGRVIAPLAPTKAYYPAADQFTTEVSVRSTVQEDLYLILAGWTEDGSATIKAIINPLVTWLWVGFLVFIVGTLVAMWPDPREARQFARLQSREVTAGVQAD